RSESPLWAAVYAALSWCQPVSASVTVTTRLPTTAPPGESSRTRSDSFSPAALAWTTAPPVYVCPAVVAMPGGPGTQNGDALATPAAPAAAPDARSAQLPSKLPPGGATRATTELALYLPVQPCCPLSRLGFCESSLPPAGGAGQDVGVTVLATVTVTLVVATPPSFALAWALIVCCPLASEEVSMTVLQLPVPVAATGVPPSTRTVTWAMPESSEAVPDTVSCPE